MIRRNPARTAWIVLLLSFTTFCVLAVSIPLGIRNYLLHGTVSPPGTLRVASGTVLLVNAGSDEPIAVTDTRTVKEGTLIQTDQTSQAILGLAAGDGPGASEVATVQIYPDAQVMLVQSDWPRFALSSDPVRVAIQVTSGRVRINTAAITPNGMVFGVSTPQAGIDLDPGSYAVLVTDGQTMSATRFGQAIVTANGSQVTVGDGLSTVVPAGGAPAPPAVAADNLIANGTFQEPLGPPDWLVSNYPDASADPTAGKAEIVTDGDRKAVRFSRINQPPTHTETAITQVLDQSVHDYEYLNLQMDVLLRWQSLPGAGEQSSEFPLMFRLDYTDVYGNHQFWTHGFYYRDPPSQWVVTGGVKIPQNLWYPFESTNLFDRLKEEGLPAPAKINYVKIYASGHNYDSLVSEVQLIAR